MAQDRPSPAPPTATGWYVVWHPKTAGGHDRRVYFCVETSASGNVACMSARPTEDEEFVSVSHSRFAAALWHGPFKSRKEAAAALGTSNP